MPCYMACVLRPSNLPGHVITLRDALPRLLGLSYARSFCTMLEENNLLRGKAITFCPAGREYPFEPCPASRPSTHSRRHPLQAHMPQPSRVSLRVNEVSMGGGDGGQRTLVIFLFMFHLLFFTFCYLYLDKPTLTRFHLLFFIFYSFHLDKPTLTFHLLFFTFCYLYLDKGSNVYNP
jgi:hypothetical protein